MTRDSPRQARIETEHDDPATARRLARTLRPDNTAEMDTRVEGSRVVTRVERPTTGSLESTVDDYVVNLQTGLAVLAQDSNHNADTDRATTETDNE